MPRSNRFLAALLVVAVAACSDMTSPAATTPPASARLSRGGANSASLVPPGATMNVGDTLRLLPLLVGKNGNDKNIKSVTYAITAGPADAISIDADGLVTALAPGMVAVEATINGHYTAASTIEVLWPSLPGGSGF